MENKSVDVAATATGDRSGGHEVAATRTTKGYTFDRYSTRAFGNNITNRHVVSRCGLSDLQQTIRTLKSRTPFSCPRDSEGDVVMDDAVMTPKIEKKDNVIDHNPVDVFQTPVVVGGGVANDPATEGKRLARQLRLVAERLGTPTATAPPEGVEDVNVVEGQRRVKSLASASTEERPKAISRRCSILGDMGAPILDLNGFDAQGDRRRNSIATPLIASSQTADELVDGQKGGVKLSKTRVTELETRIAQLEDENQEAAVILEGYQGSIAQLQDKYSKDAVAWTSENALMATEVSRLRKERQQIHDQFSVLYKSKYLPLKQEIGSLQQRASSATEEARSAREEIRMLSKQLESSKMSESALKKALEASQAQVSAAQEEARVACSRLQVVQDKLMVETRQISEQYTSKIHQLEEMMLSKDKELQACRDKLVSLRETCDEIIHQKEVAITGYQRKKLELDVREEEICSLQTRLNEAEKMLDKFANPIGTRSQTLGRAPSPSNIPNTNQNRSLC